MSTAHRADDEPFRPDQDPQDGAEQSLDAAERELGLIERQLAGAQEELLRTRAEMDNLRKRVVREVENARRYAGERVLSDLLPVADSLEQGLAAIAGDDPAREGMELTRRQLLAALERHGVVQVDPAGQAFDPALHEAISTQPAAGGQADGTVLNVLQKGYRLHDRTLRPALVVVARAGDA
ncbi:MAG: nucleotide exchange factor GrpE [Xanthomonadales bacterium]|nr:nucleotide exchange factor GrpE [Xanthomonadales bacterium]